MFKLIALLLAIASHACAQTPQELLRLAQDAYKNPDGYEVKGRGVVQPKGSSWQISFEVSIAAAPSSFENPRPPAQPSERVGGRTQFVNVVGGSDEKPTIAIPFAVLGALDRIAENVASVTETGTETVPLNGAPVPCRLLQVQYNVPADSPESGIVTYSICSDRHLVLKKVITFPAGPRANGPAVPWTLTFDTAQFNRPAPQWLVEMKDLPTVRIRKEWIGRPAPDFKLKDLNGNTITLSSMRGKVVLLDFWSISCGPCIREMPMVEAVGEEHKGALTVWGVSFDQPDKDKKWLLQHQRNLTTLSDLDFVVSELYKVHGIPALVLIGTDGKVKNYWEGELPESDLEKAIQQASRH